MSISQPPVEHRQSGQSADDVDGLLRDFFRASLPSPWPAFARPAREVILPLPRPASWKQRFRSSLALAASLILLAVSLWLLSGKMSHQPMPLIPGGEGTATKQIPGDESPHAPIQSEKK